MASLVLTGDTSGQVTLAAPAVAGTTTLTLPASTGNVLVDVARSIATNGYLTLSDGLIIQWGTGSANTTGVTNTFPIAFPTACRVVVALNTNQTNPPAPSVDTFTTTSFRAIVNAGGPTINYIALGN